MARSKAVAWVSIVAGLTLAVGVGVPRTHAQPPLPAPTQARPSRAHAALNMGLEANRRGEYEQADVHLKQASLSVADLSPSEQKELTSALDLNTKALAARRAGAEHLNLVEEAIRQGKKAEAGELLRKVQSNPHLGAAERQKAQQLGEQVRMHTSLKPNTGTAQPPPAGAPSADPKQLLVEARAALDRGELDKAEQMAEASAKGDSSWHLWGDSPAAVKRDVQAARTRQATPNAPTAAEGEKGGMFSSVRGLFTSKKPEAPALPPPTPPGSSKSPVTQTGFQGPGKSTEAPIPPLPGVGAPLLGTPPGAADDPATKQARTLLQQARQALNAGDYPKAIQFAGQAKSLHPNLGPNDDTPDKVVVDVQQAVLSKGPGAAPGKPTTPTAPTSDDPKVLLAQGRELLAAGKLDEATHVGNRARSAASRNKSGWFGLFEDSPDKLIQDIDRARNARNQDESVKLLADGRRKLGIGQLDEAAQCAYQAQSKHGPYSMLDLGDRPQKLLADVQTARDKQRGKRTPPPAPPGTGPEVVQVPKPGLPLGARPAPDPVTPTGPATPFAKLPTPGAPLAAPGMPSAPGGVDVAKQRAVEFLMEAKKLQGGNRLIEARKLALDAQALRASYAPGEETPEQVLIQLSSACYKRLKALEQESAQVVATANGDPRKLEEACQKLMIAREHAVAFGLDTQPLDSRLAQMRPAGAPPAPPVPGGPPMPEPPGTISVAGGPEVPSDDPGTNMLVQARVELKNNQTGNARRLAESAYKTGTPGSPLQAEAERMLKTIDAEEFNQRRSEAQRAYEAGCAAHRRREFSQAATIFQAIDKKLLEDPQRSHMAQISMTPEMQPRNLAGGTSTAALKPGTPDSGPPTPQHMGQTAPDFGRASVSDGSPEKDLLKQTMAMQDIKFQQLRQEGLNAQRDASDRFKSGDTEGALNALETFINELNDVQLDSDRVALLRRPVDARLLQFKTLKAQRDFEKSTLAKKDAVNHGRGQLALVKENKENKVKELMDQHRSFYKEGKYKEAEMYAMAAYDLDPDNAMAAAAVKMSRIQRNQTQYSKVKERGEKMFVDALDQAQDVGEYADTHQPVVFDPELTRRNARERKMYGQGITIGTKGEKEREIESKLNTPVRLNFTDTPLSQAIEDLRSWQDINIVVDLPALRNEGVDLKTPVTMKLENVSLKSALNLLLHQVHLTYVVKDEVLNVTTKKEASGRQETKTYQVADLVIPVENFALPNSANVMKILDSKLAPKNGFGSAATPYAGPLSLPGGQQASSPGSGMVGSSSPGAGTNGGIPVADLTASNRRPGQTMEDLLIKLVTNTIAPQSWSDMGGQGTIDYFPLGMALVINQTPDVQEQIQQLLDALRRLQELEVAVEVRFITLAENFYERIGLDFNINVKTDRETARFEPQLTQNAFKPLNFVNDFSPDHFITGLTPAGTFTSDLDIPIRTSSFGMGIPPFGGFPNIPGGNGGIELGLAFLSDIQVFLFMEAAQGDQRTNVMQAPKLTLFNGQTASILIQDQQFFVTDVVPSFAGGQITFVPTNTPIPTGVALPIQAVVSADRRFVRLSMQQLTITNLASAVVPLFPLVFAVTPQFEGGFAGQPVLFTQFIQQPVINTIQVNTTVTVPDGGTVVLGGLKRLSEGRNEFGPPVLSKIPYVNRLFKNVGFGREVTSLLIMVTPRIIINEEEEFRQTGVGIPPTGP